MRNPVIQPSFAAGELSPSLQARPDMAKYQVGLKLCENWIPLESGGVARRPGSLHVGEQFRSDWKGRYIPFRFSDEQALVLAFEQQVIRVIYRGGLVLSPTQPGQIFGIAHPYLEAELPFIKYTQSADVLTLTHPAHPPIELRRLANDNWQLVVLDFNISIQAPGIIIATAEGNLNLQQNQTAPAKVTNRYCVTAVAKDTGEESLPSDIAESLHWPLTSQSVWNRIDWAPVADAESYNVYKYYAGNFGLLGNTKELTLKDDNIRPDGSITPPEFKNPFANGNNPGATGLFEQRRWFGGSVQKPDTIYGSKSGNYKNFGKSFPVQDDDAIEATLATNEAHAIRHFVAASDLLAFTDQALFRLGGGERDVLTPSTISAKPHAMVGAGHQRPIVVEGDILFVKERGSRVYSVAFDFTFNRYVPTDLTVLARHLFRRRKVVDCAWQAEPDKVLWLVMSDGKLASLTYGREQEIFAWARHDVGGFVESVCVIPEGDNDAVYLLVRRVIAGITKRYYERLEPRYDGENITDAWYLDCARRYTGAPARTISGLQYLEGQTVQVFADGGRQPDRVVQNGSIMIQRAASNVLVGLGYSSTLETLALDTGTPTTQSKRKKIVAVTARVQDARGIKAGTDLLHLTEHKERNRRIPMGQPIPTETGDIRLPVDSVWKTQGSIYVRVDDPVPAEIGFLIPETEIGDT